MEEYQILNNKTETGDIIIFDPIQIEQNNLMYDLNIETKEDKIDFSINDKKKFPSVKYIRTMSFIEIKELNKVFSLLNSFKEFYDYLKSLSSNKKLKIKNYNDKISLILLIEVLLEQEEIEIDLFPTKKDLNSNIKEIYTELLNINKKIDTLTNINNKLNNEIDALKTDNKKLNREINSLKEENNKLKNEISLLKNGFSNKNVKETKKPEKTIQLSKENITPSNPEESMIMKEEEKRMIFSEIENKMNKKIKKIKKLYQATVDGGESKDFHLKCDNIPNTLVLIKSKGQRRFGGFTPIPWIGREKKIWLKDPEMKTFVFSLDNKKIYNLKNTNIDAIYHYKDSGPCFGAGKDIAIDGNPIIENNFYTEQASYDYKGDNKALSECSSKNKGKIIDYKVFQVIFN